MHYKKTKQCTCKLIHLNNFLNPKLKCGAALLYPVETVKSHKNWQMNVQIALTMQYRLSKTLVATFHYFESFPHRRGLTKLIVSPMHFCHSQAISMLASLWATIKNVAAVNSRLYFFAKFLVDLKKKLIIFVNGGWWMSPVFCLTLEKVSCKSFKCFNNT